MKHAAPLRIFLFSVWSVVAGNTPADTPPAPPLAPGYSQLGYALPRPGSYTLPPLGKAADGEVLLSDGRAVHLRSLFGDKLVVLSFIYSTCSDVNGCPLATFVLHQIKAAMDRRPDLAAHLRLISLSFDPEHDTPRVMRLYGDNFLGGHGEWRFLTTQSQRELQPILAAYGQHIQREYDPNGKPLDSFSHLLRVFLIDRQGNIRNIYSVSFLHAAVLMNDVETLLMGRGRDTVRPPGTTAQNGAELDATLARAPHSDAKKSVHHTQQLLGLVRHPPLGLPPLPIPPDNPVTRAKVELGRKLFFDRRLSLNGTMSCAMCHIPEQGFTSNELATSVGIEGRTVRRNAPTLFNVGYRKHLFHDGRETALKRQIWGPMLNSNEMGNPSPGYVIDRLQALRDYQGLFEHAFAGKGPDMETLGMAIASYERTLLSADSPFDRWYFGHEKNAMSPAAVRGFRLFSGKANCVACHQVNQRYALFSDNGVHNTGLGWYRAMHAEPPTRRVQLAPGVFVNVASDVIDAVSEQPPSDLGRYEVTQDPHDRWKYATPSLRNVALTAPYMHDGSLSSLEQVVEFYNGGGYPNENLDPLIRPLHLSTNEIHDLVMFLRALTGNDVNLIVNDALATPVGDVSAADSVAADLAH